MTILRAFPILCLLAALLPFPASLGAAVDKSLVVAATIFPAADIARRVAGPAVRVIQVLPAGASPHTFDLTPGKVRELQQAEIIFKIDGLDDWIDGIADSLPRAKVVALHRGIPRLPATEVGHDHGVHASRSEHGLDPHYWLSAANGQAMARTIADALAAADPAHAPIYEANCRDTSDELARLHAELKETLAGLENNKLIVLHDGWRYFAAAYGLEIVAVFQSSPGREPTPRDLQKLYRTARHSRVRTIFSEPQLSSASLEPMLRDLGLALVVLDPLGGSEPGDSYAGLLRRNARAVLRALER